ncbi:MAG: hypothetical protein K2X00_21335 [Nitrospiraceae bacterium]|jgi:hypothetical protein|nr:hypothetical protein [Nitrospiraceae bacterium]
MGNDEQQVHLRQGHNPTTVTMAADLIKSHNPGNLVQAYAQVGQGPQAPQGNSVSPQQSSTAPAVAPTQPRQ